MIDTEVWHLVLDIGLSIDCLLCLYIRSILLLWHFLWNLHNFGIIIITDFKIFGSHNLHALDLSCIVFAVLALLFTAKMALMGGGLDFVLQKVINLIDYMLVPINLLI